RLVRGLALRLPPLLPPALEREPAEHGRLTGAGRRAAGGLARVGRVPEVAEDRHAARLELGRLRVLVLVDHVLVEALGHQLLGLRLHPRRDERGHVQPRVAVEHQLVVDDLVRDVGRHLARRQLVPWDRPFATEERVDRELVRRDGLGGMFEGQGSPSPGSMRRYTSRRGQYLRRARNEPLRSPTARSPPGSGAGGARADRRRDHATSLSRVFSAPMWLRDLGLLAWFLVGVAILLVGVRILLVALGGRRQDRELGQQLGCERNLRREAER